MSKWVGALWTAYRSVPPYLGLGSAALSWKSTPGEGVLCARTRGRSAVRTRLPVAIPSTCKNARRVITPAGLTRHGRSAMRDSFRHTDEISVLLLRIYVILSNR